MFREDTSIVSIVERYCLERDISTAYAGHLRRAAIHIERWAGQTIQPSDLSECLLCEFLEDLQKGNRTGRTVNNYRQCLLTIWNHCADIGHGHCLPPVFRRVRKCKAIAPIVIAFSAAEAEHLAIIAQKFGWPGCDGPVWEAAIRTGWDSGLRLSDVLGLSQANISGSFVSCVQQKNNRPITKRLYPSTLAAIQSTHPDGRALLFPWLYHRRKFYLAFNQIVKWAELTGGFRKLRRGGATACEILQRGSAAEFLGHQDNGAIARQSYIDLRLVSNTSIMPPELG